METPPQSPKKPDDVERADLQRLAEENMKRLHKPATNPVDYTKLRPLVGKPESKKELYDNTMRAEAYRLSRLPGEKRPAWQILEDQKRTSELPKKDEGH